MATRYKFEDDALSVSSLESAVAEENNNQEFGPVYSYFCELVDYCFAIKRENPTMNVTDIVKVAKEMFTDFVEKSENQNFCQRVSLTRNSSASLDSRLRMVSNSSSQALVSGGVRKSSTSSQNFHQVDFENLGMSFSGISGSCVEPFSLNGNNLLAITEGSEEDSETFSRDINIISDNHGQEPNKCCPTCENLSQDENELWQHAIIAKHANIYMQAQHQTFLEKNVEDQDSLINNAKGSSEVCQLRQEIIDIKRRLSVLEKFNKQCEMTSSRKRGSRLAIKFPELLEATSKLPGKGQKCPSNIDSMLGIDSPTSATKVHLESTQINPASGRGSRLAIRFPDLLETTIKKPRKGQKRPSNIVVHHVFARISTA